MLDGDEAGRFFEASALRSTALDVSALLEIRVGDPRPRLFQHTDHSLFGVICEVKAGSGCLVVRAWIPEERGACYVFLEDVTKDVPAGTAVCELFPELCVIGPTEVAIKEARMGAVTLRQ